MKQAEKQALVDRILAFIRRVGLKVEPETVEHRTFMPGMKVLCSTLSGSTFRPSERMKARMRSTSARFSS